MDLYIILKWKLDSLMIKDYFFSSSKDYCPKKLLEKYRKQMKLIVLNHIMSLVDFLTDHWTLS